MVSTSWAQQHKLCSDTALLGLSVLDGVWHFEGQGIVPFCTPKGSSCESVSQNQRGPWPGLAVAMAVAGDCYTHSRVQTRTENSGVGLLGSWCRKVENGG